VACAYTAVLLLQPILQAIMTPDPWKQRNNHLA
jgi:hypothetical protein